MGFKFKPISSVEFPIVDENDNPIKSYTLDISKEEFLKAMIENARKIIDGATNLSSGDFAQFKESMFNFVDDVFGKGEAEFLFEKFQKNIFAMLMLVRAISETGQKELSEKLKAEYSL